MKTLPKSIIYLTLILFSLAIGFQLILLKGLIKTNIDWLSYTTRILLIFSLPLIGVLTFKFSLSSKLYVIVYNVLVLYILWLLIEIFSFIYIKKNDLGIHYKPSHLTWYNNPDYTPYYAGLLHHMGDVHPQIGRWRVPNTADTVNRCGDNLPIELISNDIGARDTNRKYSEGKNIAVIGDSFMEGYLINTKDRLSDLLELHTEVPHFNFTVNQANPLHYYLIYNNLVKNKVNHDAVIVGIFPSNDFVSFKPHNNASFFNLPTFRPYSLFNSKEKKYELKYTLPLINYSVESFSYHKDSSYLLKGRKYLHSTYTMAQKVFLEFSTNSYLFGMLKSISQKAAAKRFYENYISNFSKKLNNSSETQDFEQGLIWLCNDIGQKEIILLLIPDIHDVNYYNKGNQHKNILAAELKKILPQSNIKVIDLLPHFASLPEPQKCYIDCDGHWNETGNKVAFDYIKQNLYYNKMIEPFK